MQIQTADLVQQCISHQDGEYLMVGAPSCRKCKTSTKAQFNGATTYGKGDIVKWQEQLWKATAIILPADDSIDYNPI